MSDEIVKSNRELAQRLEISEAAVRKRLAHATWPFGSAPWPAELIPEMKQWAEENLSEDPNRDLSLKTSTPMPRTPQPTQAQATAAERAQIKMGIDAIKLQREQFELEKEQGKFHDVEACKLNQVQKVHAIKRGILSMGQQLRSRLVDLPPEVQDRVERELSNLAEQLCREFAGQ